MKSQAAGKARGKASGKAVWKQQSHRPVWMRLKAQSKKPYLVIPNIVHHDGTNYFKRFKTLL